MAEEAVSVEEQIGAMVMGEEPAPEEEIIEEPVAEEVAEELDVAGEEAPEVEGEEEPVEQEASDYVEVDYDGVVYEVPPALKDALLRQSDYTQKTQQVASQRKEVDLLQQQVQTARKEQQFVQEIQPDLNNVGYLQASIQQMETELQANLAQMTSEDMFRRKIEVDGYKEQLNALKQGLELKYSEFEEAQKQSYHELLEQGAQVLKQTIPDWSEDKQSQVRDYALSKGFSQQEVSSILDPRHVQILWAASQFESLREKAAPAAEQIKSAPTIKTKARNPMPDATRSKLDYRNKLKSKNLNARQKAQVIQDEMAKRFG